MRRWVKPDKTLDVASNLPNACCHVCGNMCPCVGLERFATAGSDTDDYSLHQGLWAECPVCEERFLVAVQCGPAADEPGKPVPSEWCRMKIR
jgi:hypothetical protein